MDWRCSRVRSLPQTRAPLTLQRTTSWLQLAVARKSPVQTRASKSKPRSTRWRSRTSKTTTRMEDNRCHSPTVPKQRFSYWTKNKVWIQPSTSQIKWASTTPRAMPTVLWGCRTKSRTSRLRKMAYLFTKEWTRPIQVLAPIRITDLFRLLAKWAASETFRSLIWTHIIWLASTSRNWLPSADN